ncbi:GntR family transcriptional regulator [Microbacterium sp. WCS2018Hpa-9]|uniref:GntR family transcriptional regulator n=1 Tax=Microbacterium sp. WCS2018Hpa-9 TaxID=3073635 RepID=UPI00288A4C5B|nr:GntR family transcriptional regulator [Microbacterium sp. WCS2018Hpa-9]
MTIAKVELRAHQWVHRSPVPLPELAFQHILAAILRGDYVSGDKLDTALFAQELHMSLNPIREAIIRLRDIGLVEVTPARYTKVADFTAADSCAALSYAGVLAGTALRKALPTTGEGLRSDLAAYAEEIGGADGAVGRNAAVIGFLTAVTDLIEHPRQAIHLVEATILAQCALQFSGVTRGDVTQVRSAAAGAAAHAMRAGEPYAAEKAVRALFENLA